MDFTSYTSTLVLTARVSQIPRRRAPFWVTLPKKSGKRNGEACDSIYSVSGQSDDSVPIGRRKLACQANKSGPVTLELAATAVFLSEGYSDPWSETARRKPLKIKSGRLEKGPKNYSQNLERLKCQSRSLISTETCQTPQNHRRFCVRCI